MDFTDAQGVQRDLEEAQATANHLGVDVEYPKSLYEGEVRDEPTILFPEDINEIAGFLGNLGDAALSDELESDLSYEPESGWKVEHGGEAKHISSLIYTLKHVGWSRGDQQFGNDAQINIQHPDPAVKKELTDLILRTLRKAYE